MLKLLAGPVLGLATWLSLISVVPEPVIARMAGIAIWMAAWWITEALPLAVTAFMPLALYPLCGIMSTKAIAPEYMNDIIFLFIGGFMVAFAMERWALHQRIALAIIRLMGQNLRAIVWGSMLATFFLSMWISNTATAIMMMAPAIAVISSLDGQSSPEIKSNFALALLLGIAYSASLGGMATIIGTPPNMIFLKQYEIAFPDASEISFSTWMQFALPVALVFLVIVYFILKKRYLQAAAMREQSVADVSGSLSPGPVTYQQKVMLRAFILMALLFIFRADIRIGSFVIPGWSRLFPHPEFFKDSTVAIAIALLLFLVPSRSKEQPFMLSWKDASRTPFNIILLFGGGFALARGFTDTGLSLWLGNQLHNLGSLPAWLIIAIVCFIMTFLTEMTSNTATTQMILPVLAALSVGIGVNGLLLMIPATLSASCAFMLPVATPPNAIIFGTQRVTIREMARTGLILNLAGVILITAAMFFYGRWVFGI